MADDELLEPEGESTEGGELDETLSEEEAVTEPVEGGEETVAEEAPAEGEETVAEEGPAEEEEYAPAYAAPEGPVKPQNDAYTVMLVLAFLLFLTSIVFAYMEIDEFYKPFVF